MGGDFAEAHLPWVGPLSLKTLAVAALFALGTVVYRWTERLTWVDAAYCTTGVLTTVGQVIVPTTPAGRAFTALFNLASMGVTVLFIMEIADGRRDAARRALRRGGGLAGASNRMEVLVLLAATVPPVVVMAAVLQYLEGWHSYAEALYFCIITASGLGMGDVEPRRPLSRLLFIGYVFATMGLMLTLAGTIGNAIHDGMRARLLAYRTQHNLHHLGGGSGVGRGSKGSKVGSDVHLDAGSGASTPGGGGDSDAERNGHGGVSVGHTSSLSSGSGGSSKQLHHTHHHHHGAS